MLNLKSVPGIPALRETNRQTIVAVFPHERVVVVREESIGDRHGVSFGQRPLPPNSIKPRFELSSDKDPVKI